MRSILYLNIVNFPVAIEERLSRRLEKRPFVLALQFHDRSLVWASSKSAMNQGIYQGMPLAIARQKIGDLEILSPQIDLYKRVQKKLETFLEKCIPLYEVDRWGRAYLDMTGTKALYGSVEDFTLKLNERILEIFSLGPKWGGATNKFVAKVASRGERKMEFVKEGHEESYLSPLPIDVLPGEYSREVLRDLNIRKVGDLSLLDLSCLRILFGKNAFELQKLSRGIDENIVIPRKKEFLLWEEKFLSDETNSPHVLKTQWNLLCEKMNRKLRKNQMTTSEVRISFRYSDMKYVCIDQKISPSQNVSLAVKKLWRSGHNRRIRLRYLCVEVRNLKRIMVQMPLFPEKNVHQVCDKICEKFGDESIFLGKEYS